MISKIAKISLTQYIYYNYLCKNVIRNGNYKIYPEKNSCIQLSKKSKLILDGNLHLNINRYKGSRAEAYLAINGTGELHIKGNTRLRFGSTVQVNDGAKLEMGRFTCNANINIQCAESITIGDDCMFGRNVVVYDSSYHPTGTCSEDLSVSKITVYIGNHVWLGANAVVMQGTKIEDGSIVGTNACVSGTVPNNSFVAPHVDKASIAGMMWSRSMNQIDEALKYAPIVRGNSNNALQSAPLEVDSTDIVDCKIREKIMRTLENEFPDIDFNESETLLDDGIIDSLVAVSMFSVISEAFCIEIPFEEITKENFNSLHRLTELVTRILES